jgi:hypothetical protein
MKRMMSLVLALLMLASILASINPIELSKEEVVDDAEGRAAYEVVLVGAMEPRASSTDMNGNVRNALEVGDEINFRVVVENIGDNDVSELTITVEVDDGVEVTPLIIDAEDSAVCDDVLSCPHASLAAGDYLAGGNYFVRDSTGSANLAWTPSAPGVFTVTIAIDAVDQDTNLNNNQISYEVTVIDWYDISVALEWDDEENGGSGAGPHQFTMTALVDGSDSWDPRNVELEVHFGGLFAALDQDSNALSTFDDDGDGNQNGCPDINDCTWTVNFGELRGYQQATDIEVYANLTNDPPIYTNASDLQETRRVPDFQIAYTFGGAIQGDATANASGVGTFTVTASLKNYMIYEQISTDFGAGGPGGGPGGSHEADIVMEMVETNQSLDDRNGNNDALLTATFSNYHDIRVVEVEVGPDRADGGRLDAGLTRVYATVQNSGSNPSQTNYDWVVEFSIRDSDGNHATDMMGGPISPVIAIECELAGEEIGYGHKALGEMPPAQLDGTACVDVMLNPGVFSISATVTMGNATGLANGEYTDMNSANDFKTGHYEVINYGPFAYLSMDEVSGALVMGDTVSFSARAMHQNQPDIDGDGNADPMQYTWSGIGAFPEVPPELSEGCMMQDICTINLDPFWSGSPTIIVTVTDYWGMTAVAQVQFTVWNEHSSTENTGDCYDADYSIIFGGQLPMMANFSDADDAVDQTLPLSSAVWNSVCTFNVDVLAVLSPADVYSEDLTVRIDADPAEGYSLWYEGGTGWVELAGTTQSQVDADTVSLSWTNDGSLGSRTSSRYAVFASAALGQAPQVGISDLSATLSAGGVVSLTWDVEGTVIADSDFGAIYINDDGDALDGDRNTFPLSQETWEIGGTHGTTYNYLVRVENGEVGGDGSTLYGTPVDSGTATADGLVDPDPGTSDITASNDGANISFSWTATDASDVDHWSICWSQAGVHTALEVTTNLIGTPSCYVTVDSTTSATIARHVSAGDYFYSVNAVDGVGNIAASDSSDALNFAGDSGVLPGGGDTIGDDPASEGIPQQAWIAIGLLVLVAVIAGAFILTRGGVEGGDDEFDY